MTDRDLNELLDAFLELGPQTAPDRVAAAARHEARETRQTVLPSWWPSRRFPIMNTNTLRFGVAAAAVVVLALTGWRLLGNATGVPATSPSASPTQRPTPNASPPDVHAGALDAGTYEIPELPDTDVRIRFTVPDGWSWHGFYLGKGAPGADGVVVSFWSGDLQVYTDPCRWESAIPDPPTGPTAAELVEALAAQPMRDASQPTLRIASTTPGNDPLPGMALTLSVPDDIDFMECSRGQFRTWGPEPNERYAQGPGQRDYVWAVDAIGFRVVINAAAMPGMPDSLWAEAEDIMASLVIWDTH